MKFDFDTYEFAGLVAPGSVVLFAILALNPAGLHLGDAAVTVVAAAVVAYVLGHLVAAVGNLSEPLFEAFDLRRPENLKFEHWKEGKRSYLSPDQEEALRRLVVTKLAGNVDDPIQLKRIVKQMYILLLDQDHRHGKGRLETFNGLYNLSRGLAIAFVAAFVLSAVGGRWGVAAFCIAAAGLACYRVAKFNDIYSRELVQQFLLLK